MATRLGLVRTFGPGLFINADPHLVGEPGDRHQLGTCAAASLRRPPGRGPSLPATAMHRGAPPAARMANSGFIFRWSAKRSVKRPSLWRRSSWLALWI